MYKPISVTWLTSESDPERGYWVARIWEVDRAVSWRIEAGPDARDSVIARVQRYVDKRNSQRLTESARLLPEDPPELEEDEDAELHALAMHTGDNAHWSPEGMLEFVLRRMRARPEDIGREEFPAAALVLFRPRPLQYTFFISSANRLEVAGVLNAVGVNITSTEPTSV
jgi:hypothetical protein